MLAVLLLSVSCSEAKAPVNAEGGIAIKGYDPVAYFTMGRPVKGVEGFSHEWKGAKWLFSNREHLDLFQADPEKYSPKYGGYCAYAVSQGTTADIDPDSWSIVDGKLYLNLNKDVQKLWSSDMKGYIEKADRNWPSVLSR
ncbi:MAG: YHS domain-containing (seleno)protein [Nitrospirota bacterium]